jgi:hypothetical protein
MPPQFARLIVLRLKLKTLPPKFFNDLENCPEIPTDLTDHHAPAAIRLVLKNDCERGR